VSAGSIGEVVGGPPVEAEDAGDEELLAAA
jgi:hypothetical protein